MVSTPAMVASFSSSGSRKKNNRQFQRFAGAELLIFETETGDFVEISARAIGADIEGGPRQSRLDPTYS